MLIPWPCVAACGNPQKMATVTPYTSRSGHLSVSASHLMHCSLPNRKHTVPECGTQASSSVRVKGL